MPGETPVMTPATPPGGFQVPGGFGTPQMPPTGGGFAPTSTAKGGGFIPQDEASFLSGPPAGQEPKPEPEEPKKRSGGFWGRKLFQPNTSKYRGGDD